MTNVYEIFKDLIWTPDDFTEHLWYEQYRTVYWNEAGSIKDLLDSDEDTYSHEVYSSVERDGFVFYTLYDGCGNTVQSIFKLSNKINLDNYGWCDEHEDYFAVREVCEKCEQEGDD